MENIEANGPRPEDNNDERSSGEPHVEGIGSAGDLARVLNQALGESGLIFFNMDDLLEAREKLREDSETSSE